jgi:hypothetical protein
MTQKNEMAANIRTFLSADLNQILVNSVRHDTNFVPFGTNGLIWVNLVKHDPNFGARGTHGHILVNFVKINLNFVPLAPLVKFGSNW